MIIHIISVMDRLHIVLDAKQIHTNTDNIEYIKVLTVKFIDRCKAKKKREMKVKIMMNK